MTARDRDLPDRRPFRLARRQRAEVPPDVTNGRVVVVVGGKVVGVVGGVVTDGGVMMCRCPPYWTSP